MILDQVISLESAIGIDLVTPELQACAFLYRRGPSPSHHLQGALRTSPAGFHNVKRRMIARGIIIGRKSKSDARVTLYDLTDEVRALLDQKLGGHYSEPHKPLVGQFSHLADAAF